MAEQLRLLLDKTHGEEIDIYRNLIQFLQDSCQVTILNKKPLDLESLSQNDALLLISPNKSWEKAEAEAVREYVAGQGGTLVALTTDGRGPEHLNRLLEPFGMAVSKDKVDEKDLERENFGDSPLLEKINSLAAGKIWGYPSVQIEASDQAEVLLKYNDAILGVKSSLGKGTVYLFSCLVVFGNKQLQRADNQILLVNLLKPLAAPEVADNLEELAPKVGSGKFPVGQRHTIYFLEPLQELTEGLDSRWRWDTKSSGYIAWGQFGLAVRGSSALSAAEELASMGILGQIFVRTTLEAARIRTLNIATEEISRVVLMPSPRVTKDESPNSGMVHIFIEAPGGGKDVQCLCFDEPKDIQASWPPLWLLWQWLVNNVAAEKLEIQGEQYQPLQSAEFRDTAKTSADETSRPDLMPKLKGTLKENLNQLLDELFPQKSDQSWYRAPQIPAKKIKNAISAYAPEVEANDVLFLGDTTVFGSAKSGLILTPQGIHYNAGAKGNARWEEIQGAAMAGGFPQFYLELTIKRGGGVEKVKVECSGFQGGRPALQELINHMAALNKTEK